MFRNTFGINRFICYIIMIFIAVLIIKGTTNFVTESSKSDTVIIENSINSALMQCYALEGEYPEDIYYLKEYGVWFNEEKYFYYYDYFDNGIMPITTVIIKPKNASKGLEGESVEDIFTY